MVKRVFLVGYMGSGKSTIGRYLASDMGWTFVDADAEFEKAVGKKITEYWQEKGEASFREEEAKILRELGKRENVVVATGGGAPCYGTNMDEMNHVGLTVYISVEPENLFERLRKAKAHRPLLAGKSDEELKEYIKEQLAKREPHYRKALMIVDGERLAFSSYKMFIEAFPEEDLK
ncbi:MAG: shikimate kinase [Bacteroidales bacterium]|nr:shikimate kinase [Bacteroidales bacterium]